MIASSPMATQALSYWRACHLLKAPTQLLRMDAFAWLQTIADKSRLAPIARHASARVQGLGQRRRETAKLYQFNRKPRRAS